MKNNKKMKKGTTLVEMTIYIALFAVVSFLVFQFFSFLLTSKKTTDVNNVQYKIVKEAEDIVDEIIKDGTSVDVDEDNLLINVGGYQLNPEASCTVSYNAITGVISYICTGGEEKNLVTGVVNDSVAVSYGTPDSATVDNYYHWAWSENIGWVDWTGVNLDKNTNQLMGYANVINGYDKLSLNCLTTNTCEKVNYKVYLGVDGQLHGYGWGENMGWVSFNCLEGDGSGGTICPTSNYKVAINAKTGEWTGYAWSENIGWISFNCLTGSGVGGNVCSNSKYSVKDSRTRTGLVSMSFKVADSNGKIMDVKWDFDYDTNKKITIASITPNTGVRGDTDLTISSIVGNAVFQSGAVVKLTKTGEADWYPITNFTFTSSSQLTNGVFDLTNKTAGTYNVVVINPDGSTGTINNGFTVTNS